MVPETDVNFVLIEVFNVEITVTSAAPIRATIRAYSTIVAPSSPVMRRANRSGIGGFLQGGLQTLGTDD
jgi:hypothetical protein